MAVTIRPLSPFDRDQVRALARRLTQGVAPWREPAAVRKAVVEWVEDALDPQPGDNQVVLVADEEGLVLGFITVTEKEHWSGALDAYIGELVVSPDAEGRGIGTALVRSAIDWSRRQGLERVSVATGAANTRARDMYRRLGFAEEDVTLSIATRFGA